MPVWHASVTMRSTDGPRKFYSLTELQISRGARIAKKLLARVGGMLWLFTTEPPDCAIHVQKPLTDKETALLPNAWMAAPALDDLGPCRVLEL